MANKNSSKTKNSKISKEQEPLHSMPSDLRKAINSKPEIKAKWKDLTPLAQNEWICWVISPKKPETRVKRIAKALEDLASGKRRPCCWPGCPHRNSNAAKWF